MNKLVVYSAGGAVSTTAQLSRTRPLGEEIVRFLRASNPNLKGLTAQEISVWWEDMECDPRSSLLELGIPKGDVLEVELRFMLNEEQKQP